MSRRFIFGGTTEGRKLAEDYLRDGDEVIVCVTSEYAKLLLPDGAICFSRPMDLDEMIETARPYAPDELIDATHPFATIVTRNIRACAEMLGVGYRRVARNGDEKSEWSDFVRWAGSAEEAARWLAREEGAVLLTTGSNTLSVYARHIGADRLYARVLPTVRALEQCEVAGLLPSHVIAMQGPFSEALNAALYDHLGVRYVVSKDSGNVGGVREKVIPALERNLDVIIIRRTEEN